MNNIWLYLDVVCSLNSFSWNVEVKPSKARKPPRSANPYVLLPSIWTGKLTYLRASYWQVLA